MKQLMQSNEAIYTNTHIKTWCTKIISLTGLTINLKGVAEG